MIWMVQKVFVILWFFVADFNHVSSEYGITVKGIEMSDAKHFGECPEHEKQIMEGVEYVESILKSVKKFKYLITDHYIRY